jgi:hypothetical protein
MISPEKMIYSPQPKILKGGTKDEIRISKEARRDVAPTTRIDLRMCVLEIIKNRHITGHVVSINCAISRPALNDETCHT